MEYIVCMRFRQKAICGEVNLPAMTKCEAVGNVISFRGKELCVTTSKNAHQYFARNDDGHGMLRGSLIRDIIKALGTNNDHRTDNAYQDKWDAVWADSRCQRYKRVEHTDHWLWNHDFYNAPIEDLQYIARLVGANQ